MICLSGLLRIHEHHGIHPRYCRALICTLELQLDVHVLILSLFSELKIGQKLNEGKTKQIFELVDQPGLVLVQSKDQITAGNAVRKDQMEGKAAIANKTTSCVFQLLQESGEVFISAQGFGNNRLHQRLIQ